MSIAILIERFVTCGNCSERISVENAFQHDSKQTQYDQTCGDCGQKWKYEINRDLQTVVSLEKDGEPFLIHILLKQVNTTEPVFIVIKCAHRDASEDLQELDDHLVYYYEEHTCPTNFLGVELIVRNGDADPHGIFEYVRFETDVNFKAKANEVFKPDENTFGQEERVYALLFPELKI